MVSYALLIIWVHCIGYVGGIFKIVKTYIKGWFKWLLLCTLTERTYSVTEQRRKRHLRANLCHTAVQVFYLYIHTGFVLGSNT